MPIESATQNNVLHQYPGSDIAKTLPRSRRSWIVAGALLLVFAGVVTYGIISRVRHAATVRAETTQMSLPSVSIATPERSAPLQEIVLPGNVQPFTSAPIYARTNGYLKTWYADIGAHVRKGQLLAVIETPEVDQQLQQSRSNLATSEANLKLSEITQNRYQGLLASHAVAQQDVDNAVGTYNANKSIVDANQANVNQLGTLQSFEKVYAPFDGIITARNTDIGALIDAGANTQPRELFHIAAIRTLRLYVAVPEVYSRAARSGAQAALTLDEFPGQPFHGTLVRNANSIDIASRTLLVEVDVDNPTGQLLPGAYVFVHLKLPDETHSVTIPSNTLIFRKEGLQVGLVRNGKAELIPVKIARDYGNSVEIVSGLQPTDAVVVDPSDSLVAGMTVRLNSPPAGGARR